MKVLQLSWKHRDKDPRITERWMASFKSYGFQVEHLGKKSLGFWNFISRIRKSVIKGNVCVIQIHDPELLLFLPLIRLLCRCKIQYDVHEDYRERLSRKFGLVMGFAYSITEKILINLVHEISVATPIIGEKYINSIVVRNCSIWNKQKIESDFRAKDLIFLGGISELRGAKILKQIGVNSRFELDLYGPLMEPISYLNEFYRGEVVYDEVPKLLKDYKFGLILFEDVQFYNESLPIKFFEYLSIGLPIICHSGTYIGDLVQKNGLGIVLDRDNYDFDQLPYLDHQKLVSNCLKYASLNTWAIEFNNYYEKTFK